MYKNEKFSSYPASSHYNYLNGLRIFWYTVAWVFSDVFIPIGSIFAIALDGLLLFALTSFWHTFVRKDLGLLSLRRTSTFHRSMAIPFIGIFIWFQN